MGLQNISFFFRMFFSTMCLLETREVTSLILWRKNATTASGWSITGALSFPCLDINVSQEPPVSNFCLQNEPNSHREVRGQPELTGHQPGLHVQEVLLHLPCPGGEGQVGNPGQGLHDGANLLQICKLSQLLWQVSMNTQSDRRITQIRVTEFFSAIGQLAIGERVSPNCRISRKSGIPATCSSKSKSCWQGCKPSPFLSHCQSVGTTSSSGSCCCPLASPTCSANPLSLTATCSPPIPNGIVSFLF